MRDQLYKNASFFTRGRWRFLFPLLSCWLIYHAVYQSPLSVFTEEHPFEIESPLESFVPELEAGALAAPTSTWTSITVKAGDSLAKIFKRIGLDEEQLSTVLKTTHEKSFLTTLFPGQVLHFLIENKRVQALTHSLDPLRTLYFFIEGDTVKTVVRHKELETRTYFKKGTIEHSLFGAGKKAGLDTSLIVQLSEIFGYDIDFASDLKANDQFRVLFEEKYVDGKRVQTGNILAAEFVNDGKTYRAIRFESPLDKKEATKEKKVDYYTPDGKNIRQGFLRTPVSFTRISSHFNPRRKHPIMHAIRAHKGVDYAAPTGTPIYAVADARVEFVGQKGGYGKTIILRHDAKFSTLYGHLSRFSASLKSGHRVKQGQVIGYVGMTGSATGPHLHYETRINGTHVNPLTLHRPQSTMIESKHRAAFKTHAKKVWGLFEHHARNLHHPVD